MAKVFLGGTCNDSTWRNRIIPMLTVESFNPVVVDWTPECQAEEVRQRQECAVVLYCITPLMVGAYSVAEAVDDSNKQPERTVVVLLREDDGAKFGAAQWRSLQAVAHMVTCNGGAVFECRKRRSAHQ